mmetsp:Transcript_11591/g.49969  ORF Transcript_11591/g.49969 Transcript_11591/m.49969 type:complete len:212 (-) Transcript_11591:805-1440(-)
MGRRRSRPGRHRRQAFVRPPDGGVRRGHRHRRRHRGVRLRLPRRAPRQGWHRALRQPPAAQRQRGGLQDPALEHPAPLPAAQAHERADLRHPPPGPAHPQGPDLLPAHRRGFQRQRGARGGATHGRGSQGEARRRRGGILRRPLVGGFHQAAQGGGRGEAHAAGHFHVPGGRARRQGEQQGRGGPALPAGEVLLLPPQTPDAPPVRGGDGD